MRRIFLVTLPAAIFCWVLLAVVLLAISVTRAVWAPLKEFWSAPPRHRLSYGQYEYIRRSIDPQDRIGGEVGHPKPTIFSEPVKAAEYGQSC
jgi:hypothetical protein